MNDYDEAILGNIAVIRGSIRAEPTVRELPGGGVVVEFDVATTTERDGRQLSVSVPIAWNDPGQRCGIDDQLFLQGSARR